MNRAFGAKFPLLLLFIGLVTNVANAQTINTTCTLYPGVAYCTSTANDGGAAVAAQARQQQYETGQAIGSGIGMAIFRAHFPGWRRNYCSKHPGQPFYYGNAAGDSITGNCPTLNGLANEAAAEFLAKHPGAVQSREHATAIDDYLAENHLPAWQAKSYEKALKALPIPANVLPAPQPKQPAPSTLAKDLFVWFDEPAPSPGTPLFEVVVTAHAYDGALALLRQARQGNTSVRAGASMLDAGYHPSTVSLASWQKSNPSAAPAMFYWQGEDVSDATAVMHFEMTKRAYEQMLALVAGSELRVRPSQPPLAPVLAAQPIETIKKESDKPPVPTQAFISTDQKMSSAPATGAAASVQLPSSETEGTASITSNPDGAEIFVDSVGHGHAPSLLKLKPGKHQVQIVLQGYKDWLMDVEVKADSIVNVTAKLEK